jgi:CHASE2 domain-containing sensor protein
MPSRFRPLSFRLPGCNRQNLPNLLTNSSIGLGLIALMLILRATGIFEIIELLALDRLLRTAADETTDPYITIVSIDAEYLKADSPNSIQYSDLATLLERILQYNPQVIGIDIVDRRLVGPGADTIVQLFDQHPDLITVETTGERIESSPISGLTPEQRQNQVGFNDLVWDKDKNVRRALLGYAPTGKAADFKFAFALKIAQHYLAKTRELELENGLKDPQTMRFGATEIPRLTPNSGAYVNGKIYGVQTLINFRRGPYPFEVIPASDIIRNQLDPASIQNKIVIIGITHPSSANYFFTTVPNSDFADDYLLGIEINAHIVSQIINAVMDNRPLLWVGTAVEEYLWIIIAGVMGIFIGKLSQNTLVNLGAVGCLAFSLGSLGYLALKLWGFWIPVVPSCLVLVINGVVYTAFYQNERRWQFLIQARDEALQQSEATVEERDAAIAAVASERKRTIERTFDTIHNGPLQTLADLLRRARDREVSNAQFCAALESLNYEIRDIGETLKQEAISEEARLYLSSKANLDLNTPLHELFYEVYIATLERDFPGFSTLLVQVRSFDPIDHENLTIESKRKLCIFLQEALCNVGKHAIGATRLTVTGKVKNNTYTLTILDNGAGYNPADSVQGEGTNIGMDAEVKLGGQFIRQPHSPKGTLCQLMFPLIP